MENRVAVHRDGVRIYEIVMESTFTRLGKELETLGTESRKVCIVTDSCVALLYLDEVEAIVSAVCKKTIHFIFPAGEANKNLDTVKNLYEVLIRNQFDRYDYLLALGGGVTGDLCGYAAATYLRGVSFIQAPTTLLAQVDSSIGGKTGVDFNSYKNMVGAFYMPRLVYTNIATLTSLSEEQFSSGMGEIIKHGLIKDCSYYEWLSTHADEIRQRELMTCAQMVMVSNEIKRRVVETDPMEHGERALLNFGHTLGHAIEKLADFRLLHGHCVGLGCIAAVKMSADRGYLDQSQVERLRELMDRFGMPFTVSGLSSKAIVDTTKNDKKMDSGFIRFILLNGIGDARIHTTVTDEEMASGLLAILT